MQEARFRRTLRLAAARSPFYREQFRQRGIDVRRITHPSQLGDFYTTGEDLRSYGAEQFFAGHADTAFETTGTTSPVPKTVFFSRDEVATMGRITAMWLYLLGLRCEDRVLSAFDCSFWVSPWVLRSGLEYLKCFHVEAGKIDPSDFYERAKVYKPTVIFGEPSWMVRLSEIASDRGIFAGRIGKIRGRCDEMVVCGMGNVGPWVFEELLRGIEGTGEDWQAVVLRENARDVVELHVELDNGSSPSAVEGSVHRNLRERFADFSKNRDMKLYDLRVVACRSGSLRAGARKLRRVMDERLIVGPEPVRDW